MASGFLSGGLFLDLVNQVLELTLVLFAFNLEDAFMQALLDHDKTQEVVVGDLRFQKVQRARLVGLTVLLRVIVIKFEDKEVKQGVSNKLKQIVIGQPPMV